VALLLGSVPFTDLQTHPLWTRVRWIPFESWTIKDVVVNALLYVPVGFFFKGERRGAATVVGFAAFLSLAAEVSQLFSHSRFPATTDVVCNVIGASAGVFIARVTERSTTSPGEALKSAIRRCMA
jgi:glycopeptide antibiotics resistance protein